MRTNEATSGAMRSVVPHTGAWIEIVVYIEDRGRHLHRTSHGAWIEISSSKVRLLTTNVAPNAGAWIEIAMYKSTRPMFPVAPRMGAWIEIIYSVLLAE